MPKNIFITGMPRSGKSTQLERVISAFDCKKKGFISREIRENGERTGFELVTSKGDSMLLASIYISSPIKVSRYFVDIPGFEEFLPEFFDFDEELLYIDEIGHMEFYAERFQDLVRKYLDSPNIFLGTLSQVYSHPLIEEIKDRDDVNILDINERKREQVYEHAIELVSKYMAE